MSWDKEQLFSVVQSHLKLKHLYDAADFRGGRFQYHPGWAVVQMRKRPGYYDCLVWNRADVFTRATRPKCDKRLYITVFGEIIPRPATGRKKKPSGSVVKTVAFGMYPYQSRLLKDLQGILRVSRPRLWRGLIYGAACKWGLWAALKDCGIHVRKEHSPTKLTGGWAVYTSEGEPMMPEHSFEFEWQAWIQTYHRVILDELEPPLS